MAMVPNSVETLLKISIARVWRTNVTEDRQTDGRRHIVKFAKYQKFILCHYYATLKINT